MCSFPPRVFAQAISACRECPYHDHYSNGNCISKKNADIKDRFKSLKAEVEELKRRNQKLTSDLTSARKELAERVKDDIRNICPDRVFEYDEVESVIDNLLAEMESERE